MAQISLNQLVMLQPAPVEQAIFAISFKNNKSTCEEDRSTLLQLWEWPSAVPESAFWACPTPLCATCAHCYHPHFVMAFLSANSFLSAFEIAALNQLKLPEVVFETHPDIRRSMTLNAMRMSTEYLESGSAQIFELTEHRLAAGQTDVVHYLLVYLMHAILDERRVFASELALRAESIAAYLGISPAKVLLLMNRPGKNMPERAAVLAAALHEGQAGILQRQLDVLALVQNQLELLAPFQHSAQLQEEKILAMIGQILDLWKQSAHWQ